MATKKKAAAKKAAAKKEKSQFEQKIQDNIDLAKRDIELQAWERDEHIECEKDESEEEED